MVSTFTLGFARCIKDYALNFKDNRQCKIDWICRVVNNEGYSLFEVRRRCKDAKEFAYCLGRLNKAAHVYGLVNDNRFELNKEYIDEWTDVMPKDRLGWFVMGKVMDWCEGKKKEWVNKKNS